MSSRSSSKLFVRLSSTIRTPTPQVWLCAIGIGSKDLEQMDFLSSFLPSVIVNQVLDYSICYPTTIPYVKYAPFTTFVSNALFLVLAFIPTVRQSISTYKETKRWQHNRYMILILGYIFLYVPFGVISLFIRPPPHCSSSDTKY